MDYDRLMTPDAYLSRCSRPANKQCLVARCNYATNTTIPLLQFRPRLSAVLQIFFVGGRLRLSYGRSRKVYVLIVVNTVPSRYSRYMCSVLRFSAVAEP